MSRYPPVALGEVLAQVREEVPVEPGETYRPAGIYSFGRGLFARPPIQGTETKYKKFFRIREGQFVYSRLFGWEGALAIVPPDFDGMHVSHEFPTFEIHRDRADPAFLAVVARWTELWRQLGDTTTGLGLRRQRVPVDRLLATPIPLPSLDEQRRIGRIGERLASMRARAEESRALLDALVPATLNAVFGSDTEDRSAAGSAKAAA